MINEISRRDVLAASLAAGGLAYVTPMLAESLSAPIADAGPATLRQRAARKGLLCGSEVVAPDLAKDARLRGILTDDANILTPGLELKWKRLQTGINDPLNFAPA